LDSAGETDYFWKVTHSTGAFDIRGNFRAQSTGGGTPGIFLGPSTDTAQTIATKGSWLMASLADMRARKADGTADWILFLAGSGDTFNFCGTNCTKSTTAKQVESTIATGTAPFPAASTTKNTNLNADLLDDMNTAEAGTATTVPARDASGRLKSKRFITDGSALAAGDFALSGGWGTTATVTAVRGNDQSFEFVISSAGTGQGASPTVTYTPKDGTWTTAPVWVCQRKDFGSQPTVTFTHTTESATSLVLTFNGTPVAAETFKIGCHTGGV
jgi:hypothetical protein